MKYYNSLKDCKADNPDARWFYWDKKGIGGQTRWYCSQRILKKAAEQLQHLGYSIEAARFEKQNTFRL